MSRSVQDAHGLSQAERSLMTNKESISSASSDHNIEQNVELLKAVTMKVTKRLKNILVYSGRTQSSTSENINLGRLERESVKASDICRG